jgi:site-specific recombinase XerD
VLASVSKNLRPGKPKLTHHALRHTFATKCIEAGKDVVTVAGWLGHNDNGRTVIMVYGHFRKHNSHAEAAGIKFLRGTPKAQKA